MTERSGHRPIVVLQVIGEMVLGGAESRVMELLRHLDPERVHYDFMVFNPDEQHFDAEIIERGSRLYRVLPRYRIYNAPQSKRALRDFFRNHPEIDIVQGHMTSIASVYLPIAKSCGVKCAIAQAHSAGVEPGLRGMLIRWMRRDLAKKADVCLAVSPEAAIAVYGKEAYESGRVRIQKNGTDLSHYAPTEENRIQGEEVRKKLGIENAGVIGHVGRFHYAKNHAFLIEVFAAIRKIRNDAKLLLVGDGDLEETIRTQVKDAGLEQDVIFTGAVNDPAAYYQAMDVMVFPSRYEGLPGTVIEAQASGLPILVSDTVTRDVEVTPLATYLSVGEGAEIWAGKAAEIMGRAPGDNRENLLLLREKGYDLEEQIESLTALYEEWAGHGGE